MNPTLLLTDPFLLRHAPDDEHPERPARLARILELLEQEPVAGTRWEPPRPATEEEILAVHTPRLLESLRRLRGQHAEIDGDTLVSPDSYDAAVLAAGATVRAVEEVMEGRARNAFALVRPPGHHAEPDRAMGFCLLNNVAIAAEVARRRLGAERVLVLDWDVHHGNGTQACFWGRRDVLFQSIHQYPYYPGTGAPYETGESAGAGYSVNCGLPAGSTDADHGAVFQQLFLPIAEAFRPDLVLVSAGFDGHRQDPIGGMTLTEEAYAAMCTALMDLSERMCGGRLVLVLEGGYSLEGLSSSVRACVEVLTGARRADFPEGPSPQALAALKRSHDALRIFWPVLG